ncbi:unnamed protein product [Sphagnum balticum]
MNEEQLQIMSRSWSQQTPPAAVEEEDLARSVQLQAPTRILSRCRASRKGFERGVGGGGYGDMESCGKLRMGNFWRVVSTLARALTDARDQLVGIMSDSSPSTSSSSYTRYDRYGDGRRRNTHTQFSRTSPPPPPPPFSGSSSYPQSAAAGFGSHHPREKHHIQGYAAYRRSSSSSGCGLGNRSPLLLQQPRRRRRCTPSPPPPPCSSSCTPSCCCWHSITPRTTSQQQRRYNTPPRMRRRSCCAGRTGGGGGMHVGIEFTRGGGCDDGCGMASSNPVNICFSSGSAASSRRAAADCRHSLPCHNNINNPCIRNPSSRHCMGANYAELLRQEACRLRKHRVAQSRCCRRQ